MRGTGGFYGLFLSLLGSGDLTDERCDRFVRGRVYNSAVLQTCVCMCMYVAHAHIGTDCDRTLKCHTKARKSGSVQVVTQRVL